MTIIEKSSPPVQSPSPGKSRPTFIKSEGRRESRSPDAKEKSGRRDSDLISTATSALRRLHFRSAGGSRAKRGQTTTSGGQSIPKLMVMGSSTTSETTINTSTDSSNTVYTMVTVTDAEQEVVDHEIMESKSLLSEEKPASRRSPKENLEAKREQKEQARRMERRYEMRSREILNEFDELFLENEKRINAEKEMTERKTRKNSIKSRQERKRDDENRRGIADFDKYRDFNVTTVTIEDIEDRRRNSKYQDNLRREKKSSESEEEKHGKPGRKDESFLRTAGSSSERESDDIFSSTEDPPCFGTGAPPPTPLVGNVQKDQQFFSKTGVLDEETLKNLVSIIENGNCKSEKKSPRPKSERPKSNIRTIQSELPQRTFSSNFNRKNKKRDRDDSSRESPIESSPKPSPKVTTITNEDTLFPFPPRSSSPKPLSRAASPKHRGSSTSLKKLAERSSMTKLNVEVEDKQQPQQQQQQQQQQQESRPSEVAALTLSNLEKHEKQISEEMKKHHQSKFESIFNMDSPTTMKSSPPVDMYFDPTKKSGKFEFPSCISPTEINNAFAPNEDSNRENDPEISKHITEDKEEHVDNQSRKNSKRRKRNDRKSISVETPIKLLEAEEKIASNRKSSEDGYRDLILEDKIASLQNRKYSVLTTDGSIKNFVSENSDEFKKTNESAKKESGGGSKKKRSGDRRFSECPVQRHRRVSIIQGESLRHFIFEEPEPVKTKPNRQRKVSVVPEDATKTLLLDDIYNRKSSLVPGDTLRNLLGDDMTRKSSTNPDEKQRKFSINTLGDIVSARKFSLLPPGEIYTSQIDGKTTEIIKLAPGTKGRPLATIVVQQASIQRGSISGPSGAKEDALLDVANTFTLEELHEFDMKYGSPHHCRSQSVKTPGRSCGRPNYLCLPQQRSRVASMPNTGVEEEYYRLRHFSITGKGVVNRGDSLKSRRSRSNNSVASSNSSHSTEHLATNMGTVGSHPGSARTSAECSLASSRESSTTTMPYKVVMLGGPGVGKSSLISQFMTSEYLHAYDTSLDEEYGEKSVSVLLDGEESELIFVDHPSAEMSPENCITTYEPQAYIIVYSVVDRSSLQIAEETLQSLWKTDSIASKAVILVGNKTDLVRSRTVNTEEGKNMARSYDCKFIETSVGINHNVDELLVGILTQIRLKIQQAMKPKRNKSPLGSCIGKDNESPKKWRNSRLSASLKVKGLLGRVWARDSKSKSCELLTAEEFDQLKNYRKEWFQN